MADLNRIKVVLTENKRTSKWLAEKIGKDVATISKWCTNTSQPSLEILASIAKVLHVDVRELIKPTDDQKVIMSIIK
ncbi:helix-turn-helix transcriptional regulator [Prevotella pallens]|uniref:Helix-turn-helix n=1 Tax=Prevotella pallens TaxID=60133 RepID=A0A379EZ39_9BACT|nr:helix-turn-helix transcriptional regulator [Prevotella pallens]SUC11615.1 Helix-turn-helix [Prevotella pallens]